MWGISSEQVSVTSQAEEDIPVANSSPSESQEPDQGLPNPPETVKREPPHTSGYLRLRSMLDLTILDHIQLK